MNLDRQQDIGAIILCTAPIVSCLLCRSTDTLQLTWVFSSTVSSGRGGLSQCISKIPCIPLFPPSAALNIL